MNKSILITGGAGQFGRELTNFLLQKKYTVLSTDVIDNTSTAYMDITLPKSIKPVIDNFQPDIIINAGAFTNVDKSEYEKDIAWKINAIGVQNLIEHLSRDTQFIQISSDYVFDGRNGPYSETDDVNPLSYYGQTKLDAERILLDSNINTLIIRPNVLFSSNLDSTASFVSWVFNSLTQLKPIRVVTDQISNPTWIHALSETIDICINENAKGLYHYGSENQISRYDFAIQIADVFDLDSTLISPILTNDLNQKAPRPLNSGLLTHKIKNELEVPVYTTEYCLNKIKAGTL